MKTKTFITTGISILFGVLLFKISPAIAGRFTDQVSYQLLQAAIAFGIGNYELTHEPTVDVLGDEEVQYINLNLRRGTQYGIVSVCDEDCRDIDLSIYDSNGNLIDSDIEYDDHPMVSVNPNWSGRFRVKVKMTNCPTGACYYGVGVFGR